MSDNHKRYRSIRTALLQMFSHEPQGYKAKRRNLLVAFCGSVMDLCEEVCCWHKKRFKIEAFFSDQKSRGFNLRKSHLAAPACIEKLMIAACMGCSSY